MRVVNAEEFETPLAEFSHQTRDLVWGNHVIPNRVGRDILRRECPRDDAVLTSQNSAAFSMRLPAGVLQDLAVYFAAASYGSDRKSVV